MSSSRLVARLLLAVLISSSSLLAQGSFTLSGVVEDQTEAVVSHARVTLVNRQTGKSQQTVSDDTGRFAFEGVNPGEYKLKAHATGFQALEQATAVGQQAPALLKLRMKISAKEEEVTVRAGRAEDPLSPESNADAVKLDDDLFREVPIPTENILPLIGQFLSPAAQGTGGIDIVVDGVQGTQLDAPTSAIKSVVIDRNPYSAEFRRPGKARAEVTTKRGHKKHYHGSLAMFARNSVLDARNAFAQSNPDLDRRLVEAAFGGPLIREHTNFFIGGEHLINNQSAVVNAVTLSGPFVANVSTPQRRDNVFGRIDTSPSDHHTISARYNFVDDSGHNQGVGAFNLPDQGMNVEERQHKLLLTDTVVFSPNVSNDLRFTFKREKDERGGNRETGPAIVVSHAFTAGPSQTIRKDHANTFDVQDTMIYVRRRHAFRFGARSRTNFVEAFDASNFGGTFEFSSLEQFATGTPFVFRINQGDPSASFTVNDTSGFVQDEVRLRQDLMLTFGLRYDWQSSVDDRNNLAPRFAFAFAPGKQRTVLRAGAGIFYEELPKLATKRSLILNGSRTREVVISNPSFPDAFESGTLSSPLPSILRTAPDVRSPYLYQASFSVERELWSRTQLSVAYSFLRGVRLFRSRNVNAPLPTTGLRPDPDFLNINRVESTGLLRGNTLTVTFRGRVAKIFKGIAQYTLSRSINDTSGPFALPADNFDLKTEAGPADFDQRHRFSFAGTMELPWGIRIGSVLSVASGAPFNISTGFDNNHDTVANDRPPGVTRNMGRGPGYVRADVRFTKAFTVPRPFVGDQRLTRGDLHNLEFNVDAFNVINHTNLTSIVGVESSPFFGRANSAGDARIIQFSLRYRF